MLSTMLLSLWVAAATPARPVKLPAPLAKEMSEAVLAIDKSLGLESWPTHGAKPCIERAGAENPTENVSREDTRKCAESAVAEGFPGLGKSYVLAVLMAEMGPMTVVALGIDDAQGWAAYSCDRGRKCPPTAMNPATKWGKRLVDRQKKACSSESTIWFPPKARACPDASQ
jgi:hypothetical protein